MSLLYLTCFNHLSITSKKKYFICSKKPLVFSNISYLTKNEQYSPSITVSKSINQSIRAFLQRQEQNLNQSPQGQVEVDQTFGVYNFKNCLLIHRDVIEDLNKNIKVCGVNGVECGPCLGVSVGLKVVPMFVVF